jgi:selenocysteine lyase/cysteine desulfurase
VLTANDLAAPLDIVFQPGSDVRRFDIFGTANFFNFMPWTASVEYLLDCGIDRVAEYDGRLVRIFLEGLNREHYHVQSPESGPRQSTLIVVSHRDALRNSSLFKALEVARVHVAMRAGGLRVSPHLYNQPHEVVAALDVLNRNAEP